MKILNTNEAAEILYRQMPSTVFCRERLEEFIASDAKFVEIEDLPKKEDGSLYTRGYIANHFNNMAQYDMKRKDIVCQERRGKLYLLYKEETPKPEYVCVDEIRSVMLTNLTKSFVDAREWNRLVFSTKNEDTVNAYKNYLAKAQTEMNLILTLLNEFGIELTVEEVLNIKMEVDRQFGEHDE